MDFDQWIRTMPVVTRSYMLCSMVLAAAVSFKFVSPLSLYWNWSLIRRGEWWRVPTSLCYLDEFGVNFVFLLHFVYAYWRQLEEHHYMRRTADFVAFLVAAAICLTVANVVFFEGAVAFLASMLIDTVTYSWSRRFPDEMLSFFGVLEFTSAWLPFVLVGWGATLRGVGHLKYDLLAMAVGHVLWFVGDVVPHILGVRPLTPGDFIAELFRRALGGRGGAAAGADGIRLQPLQPQQQQHADGFDDDDHLHDDDRIHR